MKKSEIEYATRKAVENFDAWNESTGWFQTCCGSYDEICSIIQDAVHIGAQMAIHGKIFRDKNGDILYSDRDIRGMVVEVPDNEKGIPADLADCGDK